MKKIRGICLLPRGSTYAEMDSPVGKLTIITSSKGLHAVLWDTERQNEYCKQIIHNLATSSTEKTIVRTKQQLREYFAGTRKTFDLPLAINGTEFQVCVWHELIKIPYATTISYQEQAVRVGDKNKARAVGMANGVNPISIIVPCHRVIGSNGNLVGFGGGLDRKEYLLKLEKENMGI